MAIWQFDLSFVPHGGPMPWRTEDGHQVPVVHAHTVARAKDWLLVRLGEPHVVFHDFLIFGSEKGNRVDLLLEEDGSAEVFARIDARHSATRFIRELCELAQLLECGFFSAEYWKAVEATPLAVGFALERSRAAAFVRDPEKVLRGAGRGF